MVEPSVGGGRDWHGEESTVPYVMKASRAGEKRAMDRMNREAQLYRSKRTESSCRLWWAKRSAGRLDGTRTPGSRFWQLSAIGAVEDQASRFARDIPLREVPAVLEPMQPRVRK